MDKAKRKYTEKALAANRANLLKAKAVESIRYRPNAERLAVGFRRFRTARTRSCCLRPPACCLLPSDFLLTSPSRTA